MIRARAQETFTDDDFEDDYDDVGDEPSRNFSSTERAYITEVMKQLISNGTTDQPSCKTRAPFVLKPEKDIIETADKIFELSMEFHQVGLNLFFKFILYK